MYIADRVAGYVFLDANHVAGYRALAANRIYIAFRHCGTAYRLDVHLVNYRQGCQIAMIIAVYAFAPYAERVVYSACRYRQIIASGVRRRDLYLDFLAFVRHEPAVHAVQIGLTGP